MSSFMLSCFWLRVLDYDDHTLNSAIVSYRFYRAMYFSAKRGLGIACHPSVRPSLRLSVCDVGEL